MLVKDIMSKKPNYLAPSATLTELGQAMLKNDFGFLPIGENDRLIGTVTDRDITIRAVAKGKDPNKTRAKEVLTKKVLYCYENDDIQKALKNMSKQHVHRLIVLNDKKRMTGVFSLSDLAKKCEDTLVCGSALKWIHH